MQYHSNYQTHDLTCSAEEILYVILDIERYNVFLSWCEKIQLLSRDLQSNEFHAKIDMNAYGMRVNFTSQTKYYQKDGNYIVASDAKASIDLFVESIWTVKPLSSSYCNVRHDLVLKTPSLPLSILVGAGINSIGAMAKDSFVKRIVELHNKT